MYPTNNIEVNTRSLCQTIGRPTRSFEESIDVLLNAHVF
nr:MAG TPA: hypothetical protein [Caudoviricetes sp.]